MASATVTGIILLFAGDPVSLGTYMALVIGLVAGSIGIGTYIVLIRVMGVIDKADVELVRQLNVPAKRYMFKFIHFLADREEGED